MTTLHPAPERTSIVVDGCTLSYLRAGAGTPVLFLHGEDGVWEWEPWMARLAERYDVIVPDHPAFGFSDWPDWLDDVHDLAYFYLDALEALGLRGVHLVGHSLRGCNGSRATTCGCRSGCTASPCRPSRCGVPKTGSCRRRMRRSSRASSPVRAPR
jgi:hypothetical protein